MPLVTQTGPYKQRNRLTTISMGLGLGSGQGDCRGCSPPHAEPAARLRKDSKQAYLNTEVGRRLRIAVVTAQYICYANDFQ